MKFAYLKRAIAVVASLATCFSLAACGSSRSSRGGGSSSGSSSSTTIKKGDIIGISMPTQTEDRWNKDGHHLKNDLEKAGYKVILQYADDKPAQQNADIENMTNRGAKILVVAAKDGTAVGPACEKARDTGAKVIAYDRLIMNTDAVDYYATFDLEKSGSLQAQYVIDKLGLNKGAKGPFNIEWFNGSPDDNNARYFFIGQWKLLKPYFEKGVLVNPSHHGGGITKDFNINDWQKIAVMSYSSDKAQTDMESILDTTYANGRPLNIVIGQYDGIAQGVINAIQEKRPDLKPGTKNWPIITGMDGMEVGINNISHGKQAMTVYKDVSQLASRVEKLVLEVANNKPVTGISRKLSNGVKQVPTIYLNPMVLTKNNLDEVVKTGFLSKSRFDQLTK